MPLDYSQDTYYVADTATRTYGEAGQSRRFFYLLGPFKTRESCEAALSKVEQEASRFNVDRERLTVITRKGRRRGILNEFISAGGMYEG